MSTPKLYEIAHVSAFSLSSYSNNITSVTYEVARGLSYRVELPLEEGVALHQMMIDFCEKFRRKQEDDLLSPPAAALGRLTAPKSEDNLGATPVDFESF